MINISRLALASGVRRDFVGITPFALEDRPYYLPKGDEEVTHTFHLPHGFEGFGVDQEGTLDYEAVKGMFFKLYRGFNRFVSEQPKRAKARSKTQQDQEDQRRQAQGMGSSLSTEDNVARYSTLTEITEVLLALPELNITRLERPQAPVETVDYSKIYKYLDQCIYLNDDSAYIDWMNLPRRELRSGYSDLLGIYCYILDSILIELDDDVALPGPEGALLESIVNARRNDISRIADTFRERHLASNSELFSEESEHVTLVLEELLAEIDQITAFRDRDFHTLFEACERFLYGALDHDKEGSSWGLESFSLFWEDLCHTWFFGLAKTKILYADTDLPKKPYLTNAIASKDSKRDTLGNLKLGNSENPEKQGWVYVGDQSYSINRKYILADYNDQVFYDEKVEQRYKVNTVEKNINIQSLLSVTYGTHYGFLTKTGLIARVTKEYKGNNPKLLILKRLLRPDLISEQKQHVCIWDYKYVDAPFFERSSNKLNHDISKSLAYEASLGAWESLKLGQNRFLIPQAPNCSKTKPSSTWRSLSRGIAIWSLNLHEALKFYLDGEYSSDAAQHDALNEFLPASSSFRAADVDFRLINDLVLHKDQSSPPMLVNHQPQIRVKGQEEANRVHRPVQNYIRQLLQKINIQPKHYIPYHRGVDFELDLHKMSFHGDEPQLKNWLEDEVFRCLGERDKNGRLVISPSLMVTLDDDCARQTCKIKLENPLFGSIHRVDTLMFGPSTSKQQIACFTVRIHPFWLFDCIKKRRY